MTKKVLKFKLEFSEKEEITPYAGLVPNGTNPCFFWQDISVC